MYDQDSHWTYKFTSLRDRLAIINVMNPQTGKKSTVVILATLASLKFFLSKTGGNVDSKATYFLKKMYFAFVSGYDFYHQLN